MTTAVAPYPINLQVIASIVIAYTNGEMIADQVMPRVPVSAAEFKYLVQAVADHFTIQDTRVARKAKPNQVESGGTMRTAAVFDYGLDEIVPVEDVKNSPEGVDPLAIAAEFVMKLVTLDREVRVANMVFGAANHANKVTLAGSSQWSDYTSSDPMTTIMNSLDVPVMRPNVGIFGRNVWTRVRLHPKVIDFVNGKGGTSGGVTRQQLAEALELEEILVGGAFVNTTRKGQAMSLERCWGKHAAFIYREKPAETSRSVTWGFTAEQGERISDAVFSTDYGGLQGGYKVRAGERVSELVTAPDLSFFFQNVIA